MVGPGGIVELTGAQVADSVEQKFFSRDGGDEKATGVIVAAAGDGIAKYNGAGQSMLAGNPGIPDEPGGEKAAALMRQTAASGIGRAAKPVDIGEIDIGFAIEQPRVKGHAHETALGPGFFRSIVADAIVARETALCGEVENDLPVAGRRVDPANLVGFRLRDPQVAIGTVADGPGIAEPGGDHTEGEVTCAGRLFRIRGEAGAPGGMRMSI